MYERLFAKRPDAVELFGTYSRANQQRMMTETLSAVLNMLEALAAVSGPDWTPQLARSWGAALERVNDMMTAGYVPTSH